MKYMQEGVGMRGQRSTVENMVKQQRRADRCLMPAVQFPVDPMWRRQPTTPQVSGEKSAGSETGGSDSKVGCSSTTTEEEKGGLGPDGGPGETQTKRARLEGPQQAAAVTSEERVLKFSGSESSSIQDGVSSRFTLDQQEAAELSEDSRAAELQSVASLKVTIQQSSESREFGQTDRTADRQTGGLHCHVCNISCHSVQVFQEHMTASEHLMKINEITQSISVKDRGRPSHTQRWCDTCQAHFSGDVITHRRTKQHKKCKQLCWPFCSVCKRHFRTPRKFVEHMKSAEHKQQVQQEKAQEDELIIVDAVGCFKGEEEEEEEVEEEEEEEVEEEVEVEVAEVEEENAPGTEDAREEAFEAADSSKADPEEYDPHTTYGGSFVVPVSGFLCRLCNKFFYKETTARHTHCRTHTHYLNLQSHRAQRKHEDKERSALT